MSEIASPLTAEILKRLDKLDERIERMAVRLDERLDRYVPRPEMAAVESRVSKLEAQMGQGFWWLLGQLAAVVVALCGWILTLVGILSGWMHR